MTKPGETFQFSPENTGYRLARTRRLLFEHAFPLGLARTQEERVFRDPRRNGGS